MRESERVIEKGREKETERRRGGAETGTVRHTALSDGQEPRQTLTRTKTTSTKTNI